LTIYKLRDIFITMNSNIANKAIVLKLNKLWKPVGVELVSKTICDLMTEVIMAMDIVYATNEDGTTNFDVQEYVNPVNWDEWIKLPVRPWDLSIHSSKMEIRVPTVVITRKYSKIHEKKFKGKPTKEGLAIRDNLRDGYTNEELALELATIDHVVPLSRGGSDTYDNTVLTTKEINNRKGNKLNSEAGLVLLINPHNPKPIMVSHTIRKARHQDWKNFLVAPVK
jgi:5-methylcytosine-specific restriction endonuclease McrA